ncbi:MAG: extracellular solute-binding protein [Lachnospiraceae bacterium]
MSMITIKDIAKAAGVSHGTVSNVLNKRGNVSYEKIKLVEETAIAMGYALDEKASLLRRGTTKTLAVLLPSVAESQYADLYTGILRYAESHGYSVRLFLTENLPLLECTAISDALAMKACAILTVSCLENEKNDYQAVLDRKIPLLFLERKPESGNFSYYNFNMQQAGTKAAELITGEDCCCITLENQFEDQQAFCAALRQTTVPEPEFYENIRGSHSPSIYKLLNERPDTTWIIATTEALADRVCHVFSTGGRHMPRIISLSSLRPILNSQYYHLAFNYRQMGHEAAAAITKQIEEGSVPSSKTFPLSSDTVPIPTAVPILKKTLRVVVHRTPGFNALQYLIPRFEKKYGISVVLETYPLSTVFEQIVSKRQEPWDVIRLDPSNLSYLAPRLFRNLTELDVGSASLFNQFLPNLQDDFSMFGGKLYALPFDISVQMLFYQRDLFESSAQKRAFFELTGKSLTVPKDYAEFDTVCRFFTRSLRPESPIQYGGSLSLGNPTSAASEYLPRLLAAGGLSYSKKGCLDLTTPAALEALRGYLSMAEYSDPAPVYSWADVADNFSNGNQATAILYVNHASRFITGSVTNVSEKIGFAPVPGGKPLLGGGSLGVGIHSRQPDAAYEFIKWATGEEVASELVTIGGLSACRLVYEQREILDTYPWLTQLWDNIQLGIRKPIMSLVDVNYNQRDFEYQLGTQLIETIKGSKSPEQALQDTQKLLDSLL